MQPYQIIVMGVSGCGKSTVAKQLATKLGYLYADGDSYHPKTNIQKMQQGIALTDQDRQGWLVTLNQQLQQANTGIVLACSALKPDYRKTLIQKVKNPIFVYLKGDFNTIWIRYKERKNHYFQGKDMLKSQFAILVEPTGANVFTLDIKKPVAELVNEVYIGLQDKL